MNQLTPASALLGLAFLGGALGCLWFRRACLDLRRGPQGEPTPDVGGAALGFLAALSCFAFAGAFWFGGLP